MLPAAIEAMTAELCRVGNASSLHASGRSARRVVEESREAIAACVGADASELIFTSGGTEADNLAVKGVFWSRSREQPKRRRMVSSSIEHHAVLDSLGWLVSSADADVQWVPADRTGRVDSHVVGELVAGSPTALVSVLWANNEVGTRQPIEEIAAVAHDCGAWAHSDAVQAVGHVPVDFAASGLDALTFTAHKLGGPYGIGALLARRELTLTSVQHGGGQERVVRSGTLDVAAIAGFAAAVQVAVGEQAAEASRLGELRHRLISEVLAAVPSASLNGTLDPERSLPGIANFTFTGCEADNVLMLLDRAGIDCSAGSACSAGVSQPSHVLTAMGRTEREARSAVRFSLGHTSTLADIDALLATLPEAVSRARAAGVLSG